MVKNQEPDISLMGELTKRVTVTRLARWGFGRPENPKLNAFLTLSEKVCLRRKNVHFSGCFVLFFNSFPWPVPSIPQLPILSFNYKERQYF